MNNKTECGIINNIAEVVFGCGPLKSFRNGPIQVVSIGRVFSFNLRRRISPLYEITPKPVYVTKED